MKWISNAKYGVPAEDGSIFKNEIKDISVHRIIHCDGWFLSCGELGISQHQLEGDTFDEAVDDAKRIVKDRIDYITNKYQMFSNDASRNEIVRG